MYIQSSARIPGLTITQRQRSVVRRDELHVVFHLKSCVDADAGARYTLFEAPTLEKKFPQTPADGEKINSDF
jgi:hypothetical protein